MNTLMNACGPAALTSHAGTSRSAVSRQPFAGRIVILGCGSISQCLQPLLLRHLDMNFSGVTIVDFQDLKHKASEMVDAGASYLRQRLTRTDMNSLLSPMVSSGDMIIDLAWNIDTIDIVRWCQKNDVLYVNTSLEVWEPYTPNGKITPDEDTIYARYVALRNYIKSVNGGKTTAIIEHGANPGLVNHWTKLGLQHVAQAMLASVPMPVERRLALEDALDASDFASLARHTRTKVIHISERDSQVTRARIKHDEEFVNTWSIESFYAESFSPSEMAWGTHERHLPHDAVQHSYGPRNKIYLNRYGKDTLAYSWVPSGELVGQISAHGETFTISEKLTVRQDGEVVYRPSVYFVYKPSDAALSCLDWQSRKGGELPQVQRLLTDEIYSGRDEVGVLLLGHDLNGWWVGSRLDIHEARQHVDHQNATTLQVAASALAAVIYAIRHRQEGICTADDLDHEEVLSIAAPYLGPCPSLQTDWKPPSTGGVAVSDAWQFHNFLQTNEEYHHVKAHS